jgi:hypothetical protein
MMKVVTHSGIFHGDEVLACALLKVFIEPNGSMLPTSNKQPGDNRIKSHYIKVWIDNMKPSKPQHDAIESFKSSFWYADQIERPFIINHTWRASRQRNHWENDWFPGGTIFWQTPDEPIWIPHRSKNIQSPPLVDLNPTSASNPLPSTPEEIEKEERRIRDEILRKAWS